MSLAQGSVGSRRTVRGRLGPLPPAQREVALQVARLLGPPDCPREPGRRGAVGGQRLCSGQSAPSLGAPRTPWTPCVGGT